MSHPIGRGVVVLSLVVAACPSKEVSTGLFECCMFSPLVPPGR